MSRGINIAESFQMDNNLSSTNIKPVVFLSHKSEDKDFVESIGEYLMDAGIDIYLDKNDFKLQRAVENEDSEKITKCIHEGISKSDYILCFVSNKTVESWWVPYEIGYGRKSQKKISTLVRKDVDYIPDYLQIEEIIDSIDDINSYIKNITASHYIALLEQQWFDSGVKEHITKSSKYHVLYDYLKING